MSHKVKLRLDIVATDREGHVTDRRRIDLDMCLRNFVCYLKSAIFNTAVVAGDNCQDVTNVNRTGALSIAFLRGMTGSGITAETNVDFRIQTPLYTLPDSVSVGTVTLGVAPQVTLALTSAHTFAGGATVTEAGLAQCFGSQVTYLTAQNIQITRNTFAGVIVGIGGTFTSTYTFTVN